MVNQAMIIGNLGSDPELTTVGGNDTSKVTFSVATSERWTKDGERQEKTTWHRVVAWSKTAEVCAQFLHKGSKVFVQGKIDNRQYEQDGETKYISEIVAQTVQFLDPKGDDAGNSSAPKKAAKDEDEDLEF